MNPAWALRYEKRVELLERAMKAREEEIQRLRAEVEELKAKRGPGRPPKAD